MHFQAAGAGQIHYLDEGAGSGILLLHPVGLDLRVWDDAAADLGRDYRVIRMDLRGHGLSARPSRPFTIEDLADDVRALMDHLGLGPTIVGGLSLGGMVAQRVALHSPDRVSALILMDTNAQGVPAAADARAARVLAGGMEGIVDDTLLRWFTEETRSHRQDLMRRVRRMLLEDDAQVHAWAWQAIGQHDTTQALRQLNMPCLILCGELDVATPSRQAMQLARLIRGSVYVPIPDAAHMAPLESPARVLQEIRLFVEQIP
jgi:3-oxoadipate enol-lactonase